MALLICALVLVSACGKRVRVVAPSISSVSNSDLEGLASYYAEPYNGRPTASGEIFKTYDQLTAAHRTLPFNTVVRVTNKTNGEAVDVRINDRGPFVDGRVIDLSVAAAKKIDMFRAGVVPVKLTILKPGMIATASLPTSSDHSWFAVQVGAFATEESADDLKKRLEKKFSAVSVEPFKSAQTVYRVRVGREPDLQSAQKLASQLRRESLDSFVVRVN